MEEKKIINQANGGRGGGGGGEPKENIGPNAGGKRWPKGR